MVIPYYIFKNDSNVLRIITSPFVYTTQEGVQSWTVGVLCREDKKVYILEMDWEIFRHVREFANHKHWGDPGKYDIDFRIYLGHMTICPIPDIDDDIFRHEEYENIRQYLSERLKMLKTFE